MNTATIKKKWDSEHLHGWIAPLNTGKEKICEARAHQLSGQASIFGTSRSLGGFIGVSSEAEFYVPSPDWEQMKRCTNWHFQDVQEVTYLLQMKSQNYVLKSNPDLSFSIAIPSPLLSPWFAVCSLQCYKLALYIFLFISSFSSPLPTACQIFSTRL